jgi:hypothetical protein
MSNETPATSNLIDDLLADFEALETFTIELPGNRVWKVKGLGTYAEKAAYDRAKTRWVNDVVAQHNAYLKSQDINAIAIPALRPLVNLIHRENLEAAYDLVNRLIEPRFDYAEALQLCKAPALIQKFADELTFGNAKFLFDLRSKLYEEAGKDSSPTS